MFLKGFFSIGLKDFKSLSHVARERRAFFIGGNNEL